MAHVHDSPGRAAQDAPNISERKLTSHRQELTSTPAEPVQDPRVSPAFGNHDVTTTATEQPTDWWNHVDLSDMEDEVTRSIIISIVEKHRDMWCSHLGTIKGHSHRIDAKLGTRPIKQLPYRAGSQRRQLIDEHVDKMIASKVIEASKNEWASPNVIAPKKDGNTRFCIDLT